jgi:hypothetical protein
MSDTAIAAAPIVSALSPLINAAASGLVIGIGGFLFALLARTTGIAFAPDAQARLEKAADAEVQAAIAMAENNLATGKFDIDNPVVAAIATNVVENAPAVIAKLGLSGGQIKQEVIRAIGRAQAKMTAVDPAATSAPAK